MWGRGRKFAGAERGEVLDLGERALLPGLINAHCHLDYTLLRGAIPPPAFVRRLDSSDQRAQRRRSTPADYVRSIEAGFAEAANFGTTTIANLEAFPELIGQVKDVPLRTWWFAEMIDVRAPVRRGGGLRGAGESGARLWAVSGLAPHAPFTASRNLYRGNGGAGRGNGTFPSRRISRNRRKRWRCSATGAGRSLSSCKRSGGRWTIAAGSRRSVSCCAKDCSTSAGWSRI